jgi:hypothetical protein
VAVVAKVAQSQQGEFDWCRFTRLSGASGMARYSPCLDAAMGAFSLSNSLEIQTSRTSHTQAARKIGNIVALSLTLASIQRRVYGETPTTT